MGWIRDLGGGTVAGVVTLLAFGGAPTLLLTGQLPVHVAVVDAADREAVFLPLADDDEDAFEDAPTLDVAEFLEATEEETQATMAAPDPVEPVPGEVEGEAERKPEEAPVSKGRDERVADAAPAKKTRKKRRKRRCVPDPIPEIARTGKGRFTVQRNLLRSYMGSIPKINSLGWSRRHEGPNGKADGMLLGGIRCNNDLHRAGIRSGDVVHRVNGHTVKSIPGAVIVYTKVRKDPILRVEITRRGERKILIYRISG